MDWSAGRGSSCDWLFEAPKVGLGLCRAGSSGGCCCLATFSARFCSNSWNLAYFCAAKSSLVIFLSFTG